MIKGKKRKDGMWNLDVEEKRKIATFLDRRYKEIGKNLDSGGRFIRGMGKFSKGEIFRTYYDD